MEIQDNSFIKLVLTSFQILLLHPLVVCDSVKQTIVEDLIVNGHCFQLNQQTYLRIQVNSSHRASVYHAFLGCLKFVFHYFQSMFEVVVTQENKMSSETQFLSFCVFIIIYFHILYCFPQDFVRLNLPQLRLSTNHYFYFKCLMINKKSEVGQ